MARGATPPKPATSKARISGAPLTGEQRSFCDGALILEPAGSFRPAAARDVARQTSDQALADDQLVEIELEGGITLWTSYAQLREDFPSTDQARAAQQVPADTYVFPDSLSLGDETRGLSDWAVKAWRLLSLRIDEERAAQLTARGLASLMIRDVLDTVIQRAEREVEREGGMVDARAIGRMLQELDELDEQFLAHMQAHVPTVMGILTHVAQSSEERVFSPQALEPIFEEIDAPVSYTHLRAHETVLDLVCRLLLEKKKTQHKTSYTLRKTQT